LLPPLSKLGPEIAEEQDRALLGMRVSELDLGRGLGRRRQRDLRRWFRVLAGFLFLGGAACAAMVSLNRVLPIQTYKVSTSNRDLSPILAGQLPSQTGPLNLGAGPLGQFPENGWVFANDGQSTELLFGDRTRVLLKSGSRLRITQLGRRGATLALEQGTVDVLVEGSRITEYQLWVGPFELLLTKGNAQATWDPMTLQLDLIVHQGYVVIAGCQFGAGRSVTSGKELGTRCSEP